MIETIIELRNPNRLASTISPEEKYPVARELVNDMNKFGAEIDAARNDPQFATDLEPQLSDITKKVLAEIMLLEGLAEGHLSEDITSAKPITFNEVTEDTALLVDFAKPGTYFLGAKNDAYKHLPGAWGLDRYYADLTAITGILIAGAITGEGFSPFAQRHVLSGLDDDLSLLRPKVHASLRNSGLKFFYSGRAAQPNKGILSDETAAISKAVNTKSSFIPPDLVTIRENGISNTYSQVLDLKTYLEEEHLLSGSRILMFDYPSHAIRTLRMMQALRAIPAGISLTVVTQPTPPLAFPELIAMDTKGTVRAIFEQKAALESPAYSVLL